MDTNKLDQLIKDIELKNKEHEKIILDEINKKNRSNLTFNSMNEYYEWVNNMIKRLGLDNEEEQLEKNNIIVSSNYDIDSYHFNLILEKSNSGIDLSIDDKYNMDMINIENNYLVNLIINNKYVITFCRESDLMKANNKYDYLCMLFLNDTTKLLEEIQKNVL